MQRAVRHLGMALMIALLACDSSTTRDDDTSQEPRPNVLVVLLDTVRPDHLSVYGYARPTTPFLEQLAGGSVLFRNALSTSCATGPSTGSLFTGLYPKDHGIVQGFFAQRRYAQWLETKGETTIPLNRLPETVLTLPELLQKLGYRTYGVAANINIGRELGFDRGFDRFAQDTKANADGLDRILRRWEPEMFAGTEPWFLYLHFNDPHGPYLEVAPWFEAWSAGATGERERKLAAYDSEIRFVDEILQGIWLRLATEEEPLLLVLSDHGEAFGEHGIDGHGSNLYAEQNRIALMIRPPGGGLAAARSIDTPVSTVDVLPTLLDLLGAPHPALLQGHSVAALVSGTSPPRAVGSSHQPLFAQKVRRGDRPSEIYAVVRDDWKLIHRVGEAPELYDTRADPVDRQDHAASEPGRRKELKTILDDYRTRAPLVLPATTEAYLDQDRFEELRALGYVD